MISETIIDGRRCRLYLYRPYVPRFNGFWIADTGDFAAYHDGNGGIYDRCRILCDHGGPFLINGKEGKKRYLDEAVLSCFGPPCPKYNGLILKELMINHKDGNWMNCDFRNLEWAPYHYRHATASDRVILYKAGVFLEVFSNGSVRVDGVEIPVLDWWYFSEFSFMDSHYSVVDPYIIINGESIRMEEIMEEAGFIQGDDAGLKEPAILHIDGNYLNFASLNLMWVKKREPRYKYYLQEMKKTQNAKEEMMNGGRP